VIGEPASVTDRAAGGDWQEVAASLGRQVDSAIVLQTFRCPALAPGQPVEASLSRFGMNEEALAGLISHLPPIDQADDDSLVATLRG
jgi:hypothetical protein